MILGIDHIGLAAQDPDGAGRFLTALGMEPGDSGAAADYGVACQFWHLPGRPAGPAVELVSPERADSAVSGLLAGRGPGLYHLALAVEGIEAELLRLQEAGWSRLDAEPCRGARPGMRVAFLYARRPLGLLLELVEYQD